VRILRLSITAGGDLTCSAQSIKTRSTFWAALHYPAALYLSWGRNGRTGAENGQRQCNENNSTSHTVIPKIEIAT
jgi:hypothetical protein